jgi:hypothetical protein
MRSARNIGLLPKFAAMVVVVLLVRRAFLLKGSPFDSGVVQELGRLNETRPGCDVVAIALNLSPTNPTDREAALAATPFRGPGFHLQEWPSAFVVRRINP